MNETVEPGTPMPDTTPPTEEPAQPDEAPAEEEGEKYEGGDIPTSPPAPDDE